MVAGIAGSIRAKGMDVDLLCLLCFVWVVAFAKSLALGRKGTSMCVCVCVCVYLILCDPDTSILRRPRPDLGCTDTEKIQT